MTLDLERLKALPQLAKDICGSGGVLTGGVISWLMGEADAYKDIDIVVPVNCWNSIPLPTSVPVHLTYFNGVCFNFDGVAYDVWPADIYEYLFMAEKGDKKMRVLNIAHKRLFEKTVFKPEPDDDQPF